MELILKRTDFTDEATLGEITIDGVHECYSCEDKTRDENEPKVFGKTAIPYGKYKIVITRSNRFSKLEKKDVYLPELLLVPGFEGVRIHPGNKPEDTEGCLLPGTAKAKNMVVSSRTAFIKLNEKINDAIKSGKDIYITITK